MPSVRLATLRPGEMCRTELDVDEGRKRTFVVESKRSCSRFFTKTEVYVVVISAQGNKTHEWITGDLQVRRPIGDHDGNVYLSDADTGDVASLDAMPRMSDLPPADDWTGGGSGEIRDEDRG